MNYFKVILILLSFLNPSFAQVPGLLNSVSIKSLTSSGFNIIYNKTYDSPTTDNDIYSFKTGCTADSILCIGGGPTGDDIMRLISCGDCLSIINTTQLNSPRFVGSAYWYFTPTKSFGFAPTNYINQNTCDHSNANDNLRLCWHTSGTSGGWRIGNNTDLNFNAFYSKYAFVRHGSLTTTIPTTIIPETPLIPVHLSIQMFNSLNFSTDATVLDLSWKNIGSMDAGLFQNFNKLEKLILRNNKIIRLYQNTFRGLTKLKYLDLGYNRLTDLQPDNFVGLDALQTLYLNNNSINSINSNTFTNLLNIINYDFTGNPITQIYNLSLLNGVLTIQPIGK